jgi:hypothetical protein
LKIETSEKRREEKRRGEEKRREEKRREAQQMHTSGAKFGGLCLMGLSASISSEGREGGDGLQNQFPSTPTDWGQSSTSMQG